MTIGSDGELIESPDPFLPPSLSALPIYSVSGDKFIVDDTGGLLMPSSAKRMSSVQAASTAQSQTETMADLIGQIQNPDTDDSFQPNSFTSMLDTNGLWLEASNEAPYIGLRAHNTIVGDNYQLLSTTSLQSGWTLGEIKNAPDVFTDFTPVPITNSMTFFWAHHANPVMEIVDALDSTEPNPTNSDPAQVGFFYINNEGWATNDVTVYYTIGGTAQNGIDYTNLTGVATVLLSQGYAEIDIDPIADGLKPNQTVILTLVQNTNYLIDPANYSATNTLFANPQVYPTVRGDKEAPCPNTQWPIYLDSDANDPRGLTLTYTILTWPTHGNLITNALPSVTYTPTNCYEGQDSFTFKVNDGQYDSAPATVTLTISDPVFAYPLSLQTCRGASVSFQLGADNCGETLSYALLSNPANGTLSGTAANLTYTCNDTNFTGTNTFNFIVYNECGDSATNTVTVTIGDESVYPNPQNVMTGTNRPVTITLSASAYDPCTADTNYYTYTLVGGVLTNGYLSGTPPNLTYTPTNGEGVDSFQFTAGDGVFASPYPPATVNLYVVAGPILTNSVPCDPFAAFELDWNLDTNVVQMQQEGLSISDFIIYRSTNPGGPYTAIATAGSTQMYYTDPTSAGGQTNYYVVNFESSGSGITYESPLSNPVKVAETYPNDLIPPNAFWNVVTNLANPTNVVRLQEPFSNEYTNQYPGLYPLPNTYWPPGTNGIYSVWSNHIALLIPTGVNLSNVQYSIAIDNDYKLYLNNSNAPIDALTNHEGFATWSSFKVFNNVAPNLLHWGTNDIGVVITDTAGIDYFSMVVTTNTCGQ
ncbi:MAG TPA: Ig-like domain-containing protein [Verrucomicrobiae bacterium]|nr:Ig-like domain-containing protein [Verrucomicrobiae bacterium]